MLDFINNLLKTAVAIITGAIITIGGIFSHKDVIQPVTVPPVAEQQATSTPANATTTEFNAFLPAEKPQATTTKPAAPTQTPKASIPQITIPNITVQLPVQTQETLPPAVSINPETFVGVLCYYGTTFTNPLNNATSSGGQTLVRGSGVIVNSNGYILTNKHVVAAADSTATFTDSNGNPIQINVSYNLDHCEIGQLPAGTHLPTVQEIESVNPIVRIPVLAYTAQPVYVSSVLPLSDVESQYADFAILKIIGLTADAPTFGVNSIPSSFPYAKLLPVDKYDPEGQQVVTYGFPGDVTAGLNDAFQTLTMEGSVGNISKIEIGDRYYSDTPLVIMTNMDISHGRSGSPLFWRGYVIGLTTFYLEGNRTESGSVASDAILKTLQGTGYLGN